MILRIQVNSKDVQKKFKDMQIRFGKELPKQVFKAANYARLVARRSAPVDTGMTKNGLLSIIKIRSAGRTEAYMGYQSVPHYGRTQPFNIPWWMNFSTRALNHPWRNGKNPRFLLEAKEKTWEKYKIDVTRAVSNILKK